MPAEHVVPQSEVIRAILLEGSPCCGRWPHLCPRLLDMSIRSISCILCHGRAIVCRNTSRPVGFLQVRRAKAVS